MGSHLFTSVACGDPQWHPHMLFPVISTGFPQASQQVSPTAQKVPEGFPANFSGPIPIGSFPGSSANTPECGFQKVLLAAPHRWFPELCQCPIGTASLAGTQWATCQRFPLAPCFLPQLFYSQQAMAGPPQRSLDLSTRGTLFQISASLWGAAAALALGTALLPTYVFSSVLSAP